MTEKSEAWRAWSARGRSGLRVACAALGRTPWPQALGILVAFGLPLLGLAFRAGAGSEARWERVVTLAASGAVRQIVGAQPPGPAALYVVVESWGVYRSLDGGRKWLPTSRHLPQGPLGQSAVGPLALAPDSPQFLLAAVQGPSADGWPAVYKTSDGGQSWAPRRGLGTRDVEALAIAPGGVAYAASAEHLYRSSDGGDTWLEVGRRPTDSGVLALAVDQGCRTVYAATEADGLWLTADDGASWRAALARRAVHAVAVAENERIYAGAEDGLHFSRDCGASWQRLLLPFIPAPVLAVAVSPGPPDRLFIALEGQPVHYSSDGGETWQSLHQALLGAPVTALALDPESEQRLYVGTRRGLWRYTLPPEVAHGTP